MYRHFGRIQGRKPDRSGRCHRIGADYYIRYRHRIRNERNKLNEYKNKVKNEIKQEYEREYQDDNECENKRINDCQNDYKSQSENKRRIGGYYEQLAGAYLKEQGLAIVEYNYHCRRGEVDLIARDGDYLVFVEVKYRSSEYAGGPLAAVGRAKQRIISRVAQFYLLSHYHTLDIACRFDVVGFRGTQIQWVKNAFDYCA